MLLGKSRLGLGISSSLILNLALQYDEQLEAFHAVLALHRRAAKEIEAERLSIEKQCFTDACYWAVEGSDSSACA